MTQSTNRYRFGSDAHGWVEVRRDHRSVFCVEQPFHDAAGALVWRCVSTGLNEAEALVAALESAQPGRSD
jgi:hypothetical protein